MCNFWHPGTLTLRAERQSVRMSKITNNGLTQSGTWYFIAISIWQKKRTVMCIEWWCDAGTDVDIGCHSNASPFSRLHDHLFQRRHEGPSRDGLRRHTDRLSQNSPTVHLSAAHRLRSTDLVTSHRSRDRVSIYSRTSCDGYAGSVRSRVNSVLKSTNTGSYILKNRATFYI